MSLISKTAKRVSIVSLTQTGAQDILDAIRNADNPMALVEQLGPHDILMAHNMADDEQRLDLLSLCSREQFNTLVDLTSWDGYRPALDRVEAFIAPLVQSGIGGTIRALDMLTDELRTLLLKRHLIIHLREDEDDDAPEVPRDSELISMPDGFYFVEIPDADNCPDVIRELIRGIQYKPFDEYQLEFEAVRHDFESELEEMALRWRRGRLADLGFTDYEEAMALLSPVDPDQVAAEVSRKRPPHPLHAQIALPVLFERALTGNTLLDKALATLHHSDNPDWRDRAQFLGAEIATAASTFLVGIRCDLGDVHQVASGIQQVRNLISLGLDAVSQGVVSRAAEALAYVVPGRLIQAAMGVLIPLQHRARELQHSHMKRICQLDDPLRYHLEMLGDTIPQFWAPLYERYSCSPVVPAPVPDDVACFASMAQAAHGSGLLDEIEKLDEMLGDYLTWDEDDTPTDAPIDHLPTGSGLIMTALCNAFVKGTPTLNSVEADDADRFSMTFCDQSEEKALKSSMAVLAGRLPVDADGTWLPEEETDPARRLLLRLLIIGWERLHGEEPRHVLLTR